MKTINKTDDRYVHKSVIKQYNLGKRGIGNLKRDRQEGAQRKGDV